MNASTTQAIFEQFLRGEMLLNEAADALIARMVAHKAAGGNPAELTLQKPDVPLSFADYKRADALMAEIDRRMTGRHGLGAGG